jgi:hypothetical protein
MFAQIWGYVGPFGQEAPARCIDIVADNIKVNNNTMTIENPREAFIWTANLSELNVMKDFIAMFLANRNVITSFIPNPEYLEFSHEVKYTLWNSSISVSDTFSVEGDRNFVDGDSIMLLDELLRLLEKLGQVTVHRAADWEAATGGEHE